MKLSSLLVCLLLVANVALADELVVTDVVLVDVAARELRPAELLLVDGRIQAVTEPGGFAPTGGRVHWSAGGRHALLAMLDASTFSSTQVSPGHRDTLAPDDARLIFHSFGIHAFVDLAGGIGSLRGGPVLTAVAGVGADIPGAIEVRDADHARDTVRQLLDGPNAPQRLSVIMDRGRGKRGLPVQLLEAILDEAAGKPVGVYVGTWHDAHDALEAGADWLVQIPPGTPPEPVLELVRENRPAWTPTVAVGMDFMAMMSDPALRESAALARAIPEEMRADYGDVRVPQSRLTEARLQNEDRLATVAILVSSGVTLIAGSQSGGLGTAHGFTFARELEIWGRAGVEPWDVLAAATIHGARRLGRASGSWEGAPANFSLYSVSPIDSLGILASPDFVFVDGERETPAGLANRVRHSLVEDVPENPLPGENRWSLLVLAVVGFAVLLAVRQLIRRAAAKALQS